MLLRDESGAAAAEYALILGALGVGIALASMALGVSIRPLMSITAYGPGGVAYVCTANCQEDFKDYCAAVAAMNEPPSMNPPTFSPALPSGAKCDGETPVS